MLSIFTYTPKSPSTVLLAKGSGLIRIRFISSLPSVTECKSVVAPPTSNVIESPKFSLNRMDIEKLVKDKKPIPKTDEEIKFVERLTLEAVLVALERHVGKLRNLYGPGGKTTIAEGKDLSNVKYVIGTGGALTRLPNRIKILKEAIRRNSSQLLLPKEEVNIFIDNHYIMASLGVLSKRYPKAALCLMKRSMDVK